MAFGKDEYMLLKWIGGLCIVLSSSCFGFKIAANQRKEEYYLEMLISALDYMASELEYRMLPLPDLFKNTASQVSGNLSKLFLMFSAEMEDQVSPNVETCLKVAINKAGFLPDFTKESIISLGKSLGKFDIDGQLRGLKATKHSCVQKLNILQNNKDKRLRSYQTLGICVGAGIAILFI